MAKNKVDPTGMDDFVCTIPTLSNSDDLPLSELAKGASSKYRVYNAAMIYIYRYITQGF